MTSGDNPQAYKRGQEMRPKLLEFVRRKHPHATEEEIREALLHSSKVNQLLEQAHRQILGKVRQAVWTDYVKHCKADWQKCDNGDRELIWKAIWGDLPDPDNPHFLNFTS
jgi:hypothetical protein